MAAKKSQVNPSHLSQKTPAQRATEFPGKLYVDHGLLFCKVCCITIDHRRRSTIVDHLDKNKKHRAREDAANDDTKKAGTSEKSKRQVTLNSVFENKSKKTRDEVVEDLVYALTASDIPLQKVDKPAFRDFLGKHVVNGRCIPNADYLRKTKVELVYNKQCQVIQGILNKASCVNIMADETTDVKQRPILNIIAIPGLKNCSKADAATRKLVPYLIDTIELTAVNATEVAGAILRTIAQHNIPYNKVASFTSDNVNYMAAAYAIIKALCPASVHVGCWAHIFNLVGECWRRSFPDVDKFVASMKKLFNLSRKKKGIYVATLVECGVAKPKNPPMPVITRWSSWLEAVQRHSANFHSYPALIAKLEGIGEDTAAFETVKTIVEESYKEMEHKLRFIATLSQKICVAVKLMEGRTVAAHKIYNYVQKLLNWLLALERKDFLLDVKNQGFDLRESKRIAEEFHVATVACRKKLQTYIDGKQPAMKVFKAMRCFDPFQIGSLPQSITAYSDIVGLANPSQDLKTEWGVYLKAAKDYSAGNIDSEDEFDVAEPPRPTSGFNAGDEQVDAEEDSDESVPMEEQVDDTAEQADADVEKDAANDSEDEQDQEIKEGILDFWFSLESRASKLTKIALQCLSLPLSSVDVERSFSTLGDVLTDKRQNLTVENLKYLTALYFNSTAVPLLENLV